MKRILAVLLALVAEAPAGPGAAPSLLSPEGLDAAGLAVRWKAPLREAKPVRLYLGARSCYVESEDHAIHALDRGSGFYKWIFPLRGALQVPPGESILPPSQSNVDGQSLDTAYFVSGNVLDAVDIHDPERRGRESGKRLWEEKLKFVPVTAPVATDHYAALGGVDNHVYVYQLREEDPRSPGVFRRIHSRAWHYDTGGELKGGLVLPLDVPDQVISASAAGVVMSRNLTDGKFRWQYPHTGAMGGVLFGMTYDLTQIPQAGGKAGTRLEHTLYVGALDHAIDIIDPEGGALLSRTLMTSGVEAAPLVYSRAVRGEGPDWTLVRDIYCASQDGRFTAFRVEDSHKAKRDEKGEVQKDERGNTLWLNENQDGDDVFGGEYSVQAEEPKKEGEEEAAPPVKTMSKKSPIQWEARERWTAPGVARMLGRGKTGMYVVGKDGRLRLIDDAGKALWERSLEGVAGLPTDPANPYLGDGLCLYLMDEAGTVWCLGEK